LVIGPWGAIGNVRHHQFKLDEVMKLNRRIEGMTFQAASRLAREKAKFSHQPDVELAYQVDDFTDPWRAPQTVLFIHGNAECGNVWYAWVPTFARKYRVVRLDWRGFGDSTPMPESYRWSLDDMIGDYVALLDHIGLQQVHVVAAKVGAMAALHFAANKPERIKSLTVMSPPLAGAPLMRANDPVPEIRSHGVEHWARETMGERLGTKISAEGYSWWARYMGRTPVSSQISFMTSLPQFDVTAELERITCPTLVISVDKPGVLGSVDSVRAWQSRIPRSELATISTDSYHVAVSDADEAAALTRAFIDRHCDA
jgi:pimeloyl-ACP methyl ester carboxylesterase